MSSSPKVYINGRFLLQNATGVQKYALGLSLALQKNDADIIILAPKSHLKSNGLQIIKIGWGSGFIWEQFWLPLYLLFHGKPLLLNFCNSAPLFYKNQIVTIHDLAFLKNKDWFKLLFRKWYTFLIPQLCRKARHIITVSDCIKNEIVEKFNVNKDKIKIVPNSIPEMEFDGKKPYPFRYIFITGIYNPRKNTSFIMNLLPQIKEMNLHIVGVGADAAIYEQVEFPKDDNLHLHTYIDDRFYYTLMKHADAVVFPSEYEGFGIPVLEALILETPVLVPDIPVYRESFGELPVYYTVQDTQSFLSELDKINNYSPTAKDVSFLKNKYNFTLSSEILFDIINKCSLE